MVPLIFSLMVVDFNPRSQAGSDCIICMRFSCNHYFNPRSQAGSDRSRHAPELDTSTISIHAPKPGATATSAQSSGTTTNFNPRSQAGSDKHLCYNDSERRYFNPRSQAGSDRGDIIKAVNEVAFQSTLPSRERRRSRPDGLTSFRFQSTLPSRERPNSGRACPAHNSISIHAPKPGATQRPDAGRHRSGISIHAPKPGATPTLVKSSVEQSFQSTLPSRERLLI